MISCKPHIYSDPGYRNSYEPGAQASKSVQPLGVDSITRKTRQTEERAHHTAGADGSVDMSRVHILSTSCPSRVSSLRCIPVIGLQRVSTQPKAFERWWCCCRTRCVGARRVAEMQGSGGRCAEAGLTETRKKGESQDTAHAPPIRCVNFRKPDGSSLQQQSTARVPAQRRHPLIRNAA